MLNSASTIATMDLYRAMHRSASQYTLVSVGRVFVVLFVVIAMVIAPYLGHPRFGGIFTFIQEFQGFISPGILAIFLFGLLVHRAPRIVGLVGLLLNPVLYGLLKYAAPGIAFLDRMAICFFAVLVVLTVITVLKPLDKPVNLPVNAAMDMQASKGAKAFGVIVVCLTLALYVLFW
jgi:SSS family solute:Na+ symporter